MDPKALEKGPFRADQLKSKDPYELSNGHAIYCSPTGGDGALAIVRGAHLIDSDPLAAAKTGVDAGFTPEPGTLRAPDISVGHVPDRPGWAPGAPMLAIEYAGTGQDEPSLSQKIDDLLSHGTQWVWVVRLVGPHRVEIHEPKKPVRIVGIDGVLEAPGALQNSIAVRALFDYRAMRETALRNMLSDYGVRSLEQLREEGKLEGREEGKVVGREEGKVVGREEGRALAARTSIVDLCEAYGIAVSPEQMQQLQAMSLEQLDALRVKVKSERRW
jgi:hypothetical protein